MMLDWLPLGHPDGLKEVCKRFVAGLIIAPKAKLDRWFVVSASVVCGAWLDSG